MIDQSLYCTFFSWTTTLTHKVVQLQFPCSNLTSQFFTYKNILAISWLSVEIFKCFLKIFFHNLTSSKQVKNNVCRCGPTPSFYMPVLRRPRQGRHTIDRRPYILFGFTHYVKPRMVPFALMLSRYSHKYRKMYKSQYNQNHP